MSTQSIREQASPGSIPEQRFLANAKLELYPFLVRRKNAGDYLVMRLGCRTVTVLSTTHSGVVASRLLKSGYSPTEVSNRLCSMFEYESANIQPLLKALYQARMIRSVNGQTVEADVPSFTRQLNQRLEWIRISTGAALRRAFIRSLPVAITHRMMCFLRPKWSRAKTTKVCGHVQQNLTLVFGGSLTQKQICVLAHDFVKEQVRRDVDLELLSELPELEAGEWLRRYCTFHGLEHLDDALGKRQGVLLSSFHFSSSHLLVLLLWLRGYSFIGAGGIPWNNHNRTLPSDNAELAAQLKNCGDVKWYTTFTFESALKICRTVNQGGIGLVFPDGIAPRPTGDLATYFRHDAARYKRAQCEVPFLGGLVQANTGVPWIYKQSNAPLIPIKLVRDSFHRFQVIVGPEIKLDRAASTEKITADLYMALEREVRLDPSAWIYWPILNQFTTAS